MICFSVSRKTLVFEVKIKSFLSTDKTYFILILLDFFLLFSQLWEFVDDSAWENLSDNFQTDNDVNDFCKYLTVEYHISIVAVDVT